MAQLQPWDVLGSPEEYLEEVRRREGGGEVGENDEQEGNKEEVSDMVDLPESAQRLINEVPEAEGPLRKAAQHIGKERSRIREKLEEIRRLREQEEKQEEQAARRRPANGMELSHMIEEQRQRKILERWDNQREQWRRQKGSAASKSGKREDELAMERADEHRRHLETSERLYFAKPLEERYSESHWEMDLRKRGSRFVTLGNQFTGLSLEVTDRPHIMYERVTRDPEISESAASLPSRTWETSGHLQHKKGAYEREVQKLDVPKEDVPPLKVEGRGLQRSLEHELSREVSADELEALAEEVDPDGWQQVVHALRRKHEEEERAAQEAEEERRRIEASKGPHLRVANTTAHFQCFGEGYYQASIRLVNDGTTAVYYYFQQHSSTPLSHLGLTSPRGTENRFTLFNPIDSILPGDTKDVIFGFRAGNPGTYLDRWQLTTEPKIEELESVDIRLIATVEGEDRGHRRRSEIERALAEREKAHEVDKAINKMLAGVKTPPESPREQGILHSSEGEDEFNAANSFSERIVFFNPSAYDELRALYEEAKSLITETTDKGKRGGQHSAASKQKQQQQQSEFEGPWSGSLDALHKAIDHAESIHGSEKTQYLRKRLADAEGLASTPHHRRALLRPPMRIALLKAIDEWEQAKERARDDIRAQWKQAMMTQEGKAEGQEEEEPEPGEPSGEDIANHVWQRMGEALGSAADNFEELLDECVARVSEVQDGRAEQAMDPWQRFAELRTKKYLTRSS